MLLKLQASNDRMRFSRETVGIGGKIGMKIEVIFEDIYVKGY